jgi:hypothetical protein
MCPAISGCVTGSPNIYNPGGLDAARMTAKLLAMPVPAGDLDAARVAEESCRIVGTAGFYPERKVGTDYVDRFTPVMERRLKLVGARLAAVLSRVMR